MVRFCGKCGTKLDEGTGLCPSCNADKSNSRACGGGVAATAPEDTVQEFVSKQIHDLEKGTETTTDQEEKVSEQKQRGVWPKVLLWLLVGVVLVAGIAGSLVYFDVVPLPPGNIKLQELPEGAVVFNGHYYYIYSVDTVSDYEAASDFCLSQKGHLATISSQEENDFLFDYIKTLGYENAYFGYNDAAAEGVWEWSDGETSLYTNWHPDEPNNAEAGEDYAELNNRYSKYADGTWNDGDFNSPIFICEWERVSD